MSGYDPKDDADTEPLRPVDYNNGK